MMEIIRNRRRSFECLAGDDYIALSLIAVGGDGLISVISNEAPP
jgi:dihydrodipicolinate synthase/N-acetylneuraminate lyase